MLLLHYQYHQMTKQVQLKALVCKYAPACLQLYAFAFLPLFLAGGGVGHSSIVRLAIARLVMLDYYDISAWCWWTV